MLERIEAFAVAVPVMQTDVMRCRHSLDVSGTVIAPIEVDVVSMGTGDIAVNLMPDIPFIGKPMGRVHKAVNRLVDLLIAAHRIAVERHERVSWL